MKKLSKLLALVLGLGILFSGCNPTVSENPENSSQTGQTQTEEQGEEQVEEEPVQQEEPAPLPAAPTYLSLSDDEDYDGLWIEWGNVDEATSYEIYYSIDSFEFNPDNKLGTISNDGSNYIFYRLTFSTWAGHMLSMFIFSKNENGLSESYAQSWYFFPTAEELEELINGSSGSGSGSGSGGSSVTVPSTPVMQSLGFETSGKGLTIKWRAASGAESYNVYRASTANSSYTKIASNLTGLAYDDTSITIKPGNSYYYRVTAVNSAGESSKSTAYGTTFEYPTVQVGHSARSSSSNSVGNCKAMIGEMEYYSTSTTFSRKEDYAPKVDMDEYGKLDYSTKYHYKKSDGTVVWSKETDRGSYTFIPSHNYKIDCLTGNITSSESLTIDKKN